MAGLCSPTDQSESRLKSHEESAIMLKSHQLFKKFADSAVLFAILWTSILDVFKDQACARENQHHQHHHQQQEVIQSGQSVLQRKLKLIEKYAKSHRVVIITIYTVILLKCFSMILLDLSVFANYRHLDCYLLGRATFMGRTNSFNKYIVFYFIFTLVVYKLFLHLKRPKFSFQCLDFYLQGQDCALLNEILNSRMSEMLREPKDLVNQMFQRSKIQISNLSLCRSR